jgi:hypothetical protein
MLLERRPYRHTSRRCLCDQRIVVNGSRSPRQS